jgi:hypothetical protein
MLDPARPLDSSERAQQRTLLAWTWAACVLLLAAMALPAVLGRVYTADDLGAFHLPLRQFYADCLERGQAFDWMPALFRGFYLTGEGQVGTYHPLHWLLYRLLPLATAWNLEILLNYPLMLAGMYVFLRRLLGRRDAALFGGMVFTFSSFNLLHFVHTHAIAVTAHLPWLLWCADVAIRDADRRKRIAAEAGTALLVGSQILLGYPQYVWFSLLAVGAWSVFLASTYRAALGSRAVGIRLARLAAVLAIGGLIGAVQWLPTLDALHASKRATADVSLALYGALHPGNLLQLIAPYLFAHRVVGGTNTHELGLYAGSVPLMLIVWLIGRRSAWGAARPLILAVGAFALLSLVLALGSYGGLYYLQTWLPVIGRFRLPARYTLLFQLSVAVLAAVAFVDLCRVALRGDAPQRTGWTAMGKVAAAGGLIALAAPLVWPAERLASWPLVLVGPVLLAAAALAVTLAERGRQSALVALVLLAAVDQGAYGISYAVYGPVPRASRVLPADPHPLAAATTRFAVRLPDPEANYHAPNTLALSGARLVDGYAGLVPADRLDYRRVAALRVANCGLVSREAAEGRIDGLLPHDEQWLAVPDPLSRFRLVCCAVASADANRDLDQIDLETTALVDETAARSLDLSPGQPGRIEVMHDRSGDIHLRVDAATRQLLVVSERHHAGWRATVDGQDAPVVRVNGDFLGCAVGPGSHDVELVFRPDSLRQGRALSLIGLGLWALWCCLSYPWRTARRRAP